MTWEELIDRFEALTRFFIKEYGYIPASLKVRIRDRAMATIEIPIIFETRERKQLTAEIMLLAENGFLSIKPKKSRKASQDRSIPDELYLVIPFSPISDPKYVIHSYEDFMQRAESMLAGGSSSEVKLDQNLVINALIRAYYDLRYRIEDFFKRANKKASEEQLKYWGMARDLAQTRDGLRQIIKICESSRSTIGRSRILAQIRREAEVASQIGFYVQYPSHIMPSLPTE